MQGLKLNHISKKGHRCMDRPLYQMTANSTDAYIVDTMYATVHT